MSWVKLDDGFAEDDAVANLSDRAFRLHVIALCYCARKLNDGLLDDRGVRIVCAILTPSRPGKWVKELVESGLWIPQDGGGYGIRNYLDYNPSAEEAKEDRRKARERMRELRKRRRDSPDGDGARSPEHSAERSPDGDGARSGTPSRPVPSKNKNPDGEKESVTALHAIRLFSSVRAQHQDDMLKALCLAAARELPPAAFEGIREYMLAHRGEIKHDGRYVARALKNAKERRAA